MRCRFVKSSQSLPPSDVPTVYPNYEGDGAEYEPRPQALRHLLAETAPPVSFHRDLFETCSGFSRSILCNMTTITLRPWIYAPSSLRPAEHGLQQPVVPIQSMDPSPLSSPLLTLHHLSLSLPLHLSFLTDHATHNHNELGRSEDAHTSPLCPPPGLVDCRYRSRNLCYLVSDPDWSGWSNQRADKSDHPAKSPRLINLRTPPQYLTGTRSIRASPTFPPISKLLMFPFVCCLLI